VRSTIADVAARSGVSTATVSRVLSGSVPSRPETRDRVLAAARELAYRPSGVARALKRRETRTLGLLVTDLRNPFYPEVVRSVEEAAHRRGYGLVLCNAADDPRRELAYLDLLIERRVDGIIIASSHATRRHAAVLASSAIPVVLLNSGAAGAGLPTIDTAHRRGARLAGEHILGLGHRRVGHIRGPASNAAGLADEDLLIAPGNGHVEGGAAATELVRRGATAIACYNDLTAIGALRALRIAGYRLPEAVSVIGFDDIEMAAWTDPPLTTVRQPIGDMGRLSVGWLADALTLDEPVLEPRVEHLAPILIVRDSTANAIEGSGARAPRRARPSRRHSPAGQPSLRGPRMDPSR
jgi:DNA-binding LacI/PurR family transcriptional regulator